MKVDYVDIPLQHVGIKDQMMAVLSKVLDDGDFILGDELIEFEKNFAKLCGSRYAVGVGSGTDAIVIALRALGIGRGDEVITVPNGFISMVSAIVSVGAKPVFVDVGRDYNIDPSLIEKAITSQTKAILPVHLTGRPAAMDVIIPMARKHKLFVIEDAAQSVCAAVKGKPVGSWGDIGCFSLHPLKTLNACGDGGVLVTDDPALHKKFTLLRNNGMENRFECVVFSGNSRLDTLQAALLLVKMKLLDQWTEQKRANAVFYRSQLSSLKNIQCPPPDNDLKCVYHTFVIRAQERDRLKDYLESCGVQTKIHYRIPAHLQAAAKDLGYGPGDFPEAEAQANEILSLPVYQGLTREQMMYVADCIKDFYKTKG
jgi:dTDP-4-amino-4,6-dideoxygalactose transaminase